MPRFKIESLKDYARAQRCYELVEQPSRWPSDPTKESDPFFLSGDRFSTAAVKDTAANHFLQDLSLGLPHRALLLREAHGLPRFSKLPGFSEPVSCLLKIREGYRQAPGLLREYVLIRNTISAGVYTVCVEPDSNLVGPLWDNPNPAVCVTGVPVSWVYCPDQYKHCSSSPETQWVEIEETSSYLGRISEIGRADSWSTINDPAQPIAERLAVLETFARHDESTAAQFLVEQLEESDLDPAWRNGLILCTEHLQVDDDHCRERLWRRLLSYALQLRNDTDPDIAPVVYSAVRTSCSLMPTNQIASVLPLLDPPKPVDTRLVALQCTADFFEEQPAVMTEILKPLADRIYELAMKFLDRDWVIAGEKAAIGQNATHALAALGDKRLIDCISLIKSLRISWMTRQVKRKLEAMLTTWISRARAESMPTIRMVQQQVEALSK
jgi:hypothetical protein